ncbi:MAG: alcohol dehydrogenase [Chloroflexota bacterium]|nr:MAG: alcohol dehydrogenase [Chloroflexota bacterium]
MPATMRAVVLTEPGFNGVTLQQIPVPSPRRMELLCKVEAVYICGTDPHIVAGHYPGFWPMAYPFIPGHEWAGTIVNLGEEAEAFGWRIGQRVAGTSHAGCGYCRSCSIGRYNLCENYGDAARGHRQYGHYTAGAYAEYVVHSVRSVFRVPDALSFEEAAAMDPASIALHTIKRAGVSPGDTVAVIGPGPMGLMVLQCARALGAGRVLVVGRGERLAKAVELGAEPIDYTRGDPVAAVRQVTGGRGADRAVECAGTGETLAQAIEMVRKGGSVSVIGIPLEPAALPIKKLVLDEISVHGVRANRGTCEEVLPLMVRGTVNVRPLVTHRFPLASFPEALATFVERRGGAIKVLIKP